MYSENASTAFLAGQRVVVAPDAHQATMEILDAETLQLKAPGDIKRVSELRTSQYSHGHEKPDQSGRKTAK